MKVYSLYWPVHNQFKRNLSMISSASHSTEKYVSPPHGALNTRSIHLWRLFVCLFVLFVWSLSHSQQYGDVTIAGKGLQILTYARHSWPLSNEGSLICHTHCDTGLPFIMVISEDPWHSHLLPSVWQWSCHYLFFYDLGLLRPGIEPRSPTCETL